tara:strand:+ start:737 stop:1213 length:477 start_codon:yes stop_codon:yes gene_type:complete
MSFDKVKGLVGSLAPTLGAALGGPVGGAAASMLADVLGCDPAPAKIERALAQATPEQLSEIKKAELNFETRMKELDVDIFELETKDTQDARKNFAKDWTAKLIAIVMVLFFCGYIAMITIQPPEQNSMELINLVLGYMGGLVSAVVSFYFGASQGQDK